MPADLITFMRWIGLLEVASPAPRREMGKGVWFKGDDCPF